MQFWRCQADRWELSRCCDQAISSFPSCVWEREKTSEKRQISTGNKPVWNIWLTDLTPKMMMGDDDAMRTIVELPDKQIEALARLCYREGISRAEAIRRAVDRMVANDEATQILEDRQVGFGLWRGRQSDGRGYVEALRAEWENRDGEELAQKKGSVLVFDNKRGSSLE